MYQYLNNRIRPLLFNKTFNVNSELQKYSVAQIRCDKQLISLSILTVILEMNRKGVMNINISMSSEAKKEEVSTNIEPLLFNPSQLTVNITFDETNAENINGYLVIDQCLQNLLLQKIKILCNESIQSVVEIDKLKNGIQLTIKQPSEIGIVSGFIKESYQNNMWSNDDGILNNTILEGLDIKNILNEKRASVEQNSGINNNYLKLQSKA